MQHYWLWVQVARIVTTGLKKDLLISALWRRVGNSGRALLYLFLTSTPEARFTLRGKDLRYQLDGRLGWPQSRYDRQVQKFVPGIEPQSMSL
jgi:hypothetical protein